MQYSKAVASLVVVLSLSGVAAAGPQQADPKRAAQSFAVGKGAYARGEFAVAAAAFEQASFYSPHPAPLLNAAEAWELAGNYARSALACDRVLELEGLEPKFRQAAEQQLARVAPRIGTVDIKVPDGARISVEGERDEVVVGHKARLTVGAHTITVTYSDGATRSETVSLPAGGTKELDMMAPAAREPAPTPPPPTQPEKKAESSSGPPAATWISFGAAAVGGGLATFFGLRTLDAQTKFDQTPTVQTRDDFNSAKLMTNVFVGVAVVSAAVGVVLWVTAPGKSVDGSQTRDALAGTVRF